MIPISTAIVVGAAWAYLGAPRYTSDPATALVHGIGAAFGAGLLAHLIM